MKSRLVTAAAATTLALGCVGQDAGAPSSITDPASMSLFDGAHQGGNPHFFFLPPMVPTPQPAGVFDGTHEPVVEICAWTGTGCLLPLTAAYTMTSGVGAEVVRVIPEDEHYIVNWHLNDFQLDDQRTYRIRVLSEGVELGHADVDIVSNARELKNVDTGEFIALLDGRTLPIKFRIETDALTAQAVVPPEGGNVQLIGVAEVVFPAGAFVAPQPVTLSTSDLPQTNVGRTLWEVSLGPPSTALTYDIRINSGTIAAATAFDVALAVTDAFLRTAPTGQIPHVFALIVEGTDNDNLEMFRKLESTYDPTTRVVQARIPPEAIGPARVDDGSVETILIIGSAPPSPVSAAPQMLTSTAAAACNLANLSPPLADGLTETGGFGANHRGSDYRADGDSVFFAGERGSLRGSDYQDDPLRRNPRRDDLGLTRTGAGRYVTITHDDQSVTKYFHLDSASVVTRTTYVRGDFIGLADATPPGGVTGPHLHFEYQDSTGTTVDPDDCMVRSDTVILTPEAATIEVEGTVQILAEVRDAADSVLLDRRVRWTSSDDAVATVDANGLVTGVAVGTVTVTASVEGRQATATITVEDCTSPGPGTVCGVTVFITPFVTGGPFGGFQSIAGTGVQTTITISFSAPVSSVTITALDPDFAGNRMEAYSDAGLVDLAPFAGDNTPGVFTQSTATVSGSGIVRVLLVPAPAEYVAYTDLRFTVYSGG